MGKFFSRFRNPYSSSASNMNPSSINSTPPLNRDLKVQNKSGNKLEELNNFANYQNVLHIAATSNCTCIFGQEDSVSLNFLFGCNFSFTFEN